MNKHIFTIVDIDGFEIMTVISGFTNLDADTYYSTYLKPPIDLLAERMESKLQYIVEGAQ